MTLAFPAQHFATPDRPHTAPRPPVPQRRSAFALDQLDVSFDTTTDTLWTYMRPTTRPSFNPGLLADFAQWQADIHDACTTQV